MALKANALRRIDCISTYPIGNWQAIFSNGSAGMPRPTCFNKPPGRARRPCPAASALHYIDFDGLPFDAGFFQPLDGNFDGLALSFQVAANDPHFLGGARLADR